MILTPSLIQAGVDDVAITSQQIGMLQLRHTSRLQIMPRHKRLALDVRGLIDRVDVFRLSGGAKRDPAVEEWLNDSSIGLRSIARQWFDQMRRCGDDVRELMHDGCPVACVDDAAFGYVNSFKGHVNVGFFHGAMLDDPANLLEGSGKRMRHVKLKPGSEVDADALGDLIRAAYLDVRGRM